MCGGFKAPSEATEAIQSMIDSFKSQVEAKLAANFSNFKAKTYTTQVVAGTNYKVIVGVDSDLEIEVVIYEPLPHTGSPKQLSNARYI